jgi:hypothetical protein
MAQQNTDSSVFMPMGDLYMSDRTSNPTCNIHLRPGKIQTIVGRGVDGDRMALRLPITMGGGFAGLYYETRYNVLCVKSFETEAEVDEWMDLVLSRPRIDLEPIPFEAQIDLTGVLALTAPGDRDRMRSWFGTQMRAFVDKHNLGTNDGWINFGALPPVN